MKTKSYNVYSFDELSPKAKKRAIEKHREFLSGQWNGDTTKEDAQRALAFAGLNVETIYYSGFWSQGDGACFEGSFDARNVNPTKMREYAPQDTELHRIADEMAKIAQAFPGASFTVKHSGNYYHEYMTNFDIQLTEEPLSVADSLSSIGLSHKGAEETLIQTARDAMKWIYRQLEKEYDWQTADEQVIESILANEYGFTEDGEID